MCNYLFRSRSRKTLCVIVGISDLPARKIYEEILPDVVERLLLKTVPYHRGSPYGGEGWNTADPTIGDIHQWDIWAGSCRNYQDYDLMGGRFVRCALKNSPFWTTVG